LVLVLLAALLLRRRGRVAALAAAVAVIGRGGFRLYPMVTANEDLSASLPWLVGALILAAALAAWVAYLAATRSRALLRCVRAVGVGGCLLAAISYLTAPPGPPPVPEVPWPAAADVQTATREGPNVLLITLDTVRPDHLAAYGYEKIRTPQIDRIAREGVIFSFAMAQAPVTPPSHASILTGLYPIRHQVRNFQETLGSGPSVVSIAECAKRAGYATGAMVASITLAPEYGFDRGFDVYKYAEPRGVYVFEPIRRALIPWLLNEVGLLSETQIYRRAPEITADGLRWIEQYGEGPFFLWLHYFDAHTPYWHRRKHREGRHHPGVGFRDQFTPQFAYDSEIVGIDLQLGRVFDLLRERGLIDDTIVIIASDHGEGLGDHSYYGHTHRVYQEQLRMVMILRYPPRIPAGLVVDRQVRSIDIMPSVLELADLPQPEGLDGESLLPLLSGGSRHAHRLTVAEVLNRHSKAIHLLAVSNGRHKLILSPEGEPSLFDLEHDPGELRDVSETEPEITKELEAKLQVYLDQAPSGEQGAPDWELDELTERRLRALGYLE
jgi:arylsulfatase A-like enzyme